MIESGARRFWRASGVFLGGLLLLHLLLGVTRMLWLKGFDLRARNTLTKFAATLEGKFREGGSLSEAVYGDWLLRNQDVGFFVVANYKSGYRSGAVNRTNLRRGAGALDDFLADHGSDATLALLVEQEREFASPYLRILSRPLLPVADSKDTTPIGLLKVGYILPGYPYGVGWSDFWRYGVMVLAGLLGVALAGIWVSSWGRGKTVGYDLLSEIPGQEVKASAGAPVENSAPTKVDEVVGAPMLETGGASDDLEWLEREPTTNEPIIIGADGRAWRILFNGEDLEGWEARGQWYIAEDGVCAQPWSSSMVSTKGGNRKDYAFQLSAKRVAGPDGFIVLFQYGEHSLIWVVGGWENRKSEVVGYPSTAREESLETNRWYDLEVSVTENSLEGKLNGERAWSLVPSEVTASSPDVGFLKGVGVAVWNSLAKFRNLRMTAELPQEKVSDSSSPPS